MINSDIQQFLIAIDYNPTAEKVAETGYHYAKKIGAEITILHVISDETEFGTSGYAPIMGYTNFINTGLSHLYDPETMKKAANRFLEKTKHHLGDETIQTIIKEGDFAEMILKTAKLLNIDIIVIGTHSRKWLEQFRYRKFCL